MSSQSTTKDPASALQFSDQPPFLTVQQASKLLHVSTWTVYQAIRSGDVPVIRWGRRVVLQRDDLALLVASKRDEGSLARLPRAEVRSSTRRMAGAAGPTTAPARTIVTLPDAEPA